MPILVERTSKRLKLLYAVGLLALCVGGITYLLFDFTWSYFLVLAAALVIGISKLLRWWYHA